LSGLVLAVTAIMPIAAMAQQVEVTFPDKNLEKAVLQTLVVGNITLLTNLCEKTRAEAFDLMLQHAGEIGANAVVGARYDATEVMQGVTEVLAYGTAVVVEPAKKD